MPPDPSREVIEALKQLSPEDRATNGREYVKAAAVEEAAMLCGNSSVEVQGDLKRRLKMKPLDHGTGARTSQEFYDRAKKDPNAIVFDVGEVDPVIIFGAEMHFTRADGSQDTKMVYVTFEHVKKHLKELKGCDCEICLRIIAAYRINKKARAGATPEEVEALGWVRMWEH